MQAHESEEEKQKQKQKRKRRRRRRRRRRRHMWPVPSLATTVVGALHSITAHSFCKDGRKISVGDCALFKPQQETSPPFIGIIRWLLSSKDNFLQLGVNWLYRPADVKLGKGVWLEAAPNEIFYSFHKDEIPAASLLHPCKVAFLGKGVELPPGISSFVCRRVYNPSNKRLWWLSDQDYLNERQKEVDQLLQRTQLEMHAAVQSEGQSPKSVNGPTPSLQLKPSVDKTQNSPSTFLSQVKGKKRELGEQGPEIVKREHPSKTDDEISGYFRPESTLKSEIAKITDKGGVADNEGVEKLVQLMQPDRFGKNLDLAGRIMLANVITVTDKCDYLGEFVQLRGLSFLDEWLQEVHKGKIGDGGISKENEKPTEEFLLALLQALDKLPVNLHALQTCNIGKSVNRLRSHKNLEIQKKARGLVDMWKKRVEAELSMNDTKSSSSQAISGFSGGSRQTGGSSESPMKISIAQPSVKSLPVKLGHGDSASKLASASPRSMAMKLSSLSASTSTAVSRDSPYKTAFRGGASDALLTTMKEEKSSSSGQSQNNSQSYSSDRTKLVSSSWKEDIRSSTVVSPNVNKTSNPTVRNRKRSNGVGFNVSDLQKDSTLVKCNSMDKRAIPERVDASLVDHRSNHRLMVKIPNSEHSPPRSASGDCLDDHFVAASRACSPGLPEKHGECQRRVKIKTEALCNDVGADVNMEQLHNNDMKDGVAGSDEGIALHDDEQSRPVNEFGKAFETSVATCSSSGNSKVNLVDETKLGKSHEASLRSINVLVESCVRFFEADSFASIGDDRGMNLLANAAAEQMSKSELATSSDSPGKTPLPEDSSFDHDTKISVHDEVVVQRDAQSDNSVDIDTVKQVCTLQVTDEKHHLAAHASSKISENNNTTSFTNKKLIRQSSQLFHVPVLDLLRIGGPYSSSDGKPDETATMSMAMSSGNKIEECAESEGATQLHDSMETGLSCLNGDDIQENKQMTKSSSSNADDEIAEDSSAAGDSSNIGVAAYDGKVKEDVAKPTQSLPLEKDSEKHNVLNYCLSSTADTQTEHKLPLVANCNEAVKKNVDGFALASGSGNVLIQNNMEEPNDEKQSHVQQGESQRINQASTDPSSLDNSIAASMVPDQNKYVQENSETKDVLGGPSSNEDSPVVPDEEIPSCLKSSKSKLSSIADNKSEERVSTAEAPHLSVSAESDMGGKLDFDLNEGFPAEDGNQGDLATSVMTECSTDVPPFSHPLSSMSNGLPASVTVAAAAKGPFEPPDNSVRPSGETGWKRTAAISAFWHAEPRKVLEMPLSTNNNTFDTAVSKQGRPPLDIDLNVPDDRVLEDMAADSTAQMTRTVSRVNAHEFRCTNAFGSSGPVCSVGGLDLDLNKADDDTDTEEPPSTTSRFEVWSVVSPSSREFSNGESNVLRNFDLNNGPGLDELGTGPTLPKPHAKGTVPFLPPVASIRVNNTDLGSVSSWFAPGNSYRAVSIPSILPDTGEQPYPVVSNVVAQRFLGPTGAISFTADAYRSPVLSSSPTVAFSPPTTFPYPGFPFGTSFPLASTSFSNGSTTFMDSSSSGSLCFPVVPSQLMGAPGPSTGSSHYPRPYVISVPDGTANGGAESSRKWLRHGLDLNAGPGGME